MMRGVLLVLFSTILVGQRASSQGTAPMSKRLILPPPPPPPPPPQNFHRDDKATVPPPPDPQEPIKELIDTGGVELILDTEFSSFQSAEEYKFKTIMSDTSNRYCATKGNCEGDTAKVVTEVDVIVYDIQSVKSKRTAVYFYIKNPGARTQLTMTTAQLQKMFDEERSAIETALGYSLDMGDLDGFVPFTNGLALESALIALLALIGLVILVFGFVAFVNYRNKKRDTKMTFDDLEMQQSQAITKVLPSDADPVVPASTLKVKVDVTTNVYQSEILAETKRVIKPSTVKTDTELYAVVHKHEEKKLESTEENNDPPASPNAIVVTADVSSSNDGSSHLSDDEAVGPTSDRNFAPPDYEQATKDEAKVIESPDTEAAGTSEAPPASTMDEDLPPPPTSSGDLPPLPPPEGAEDSSTSSPARKDSGSSSSTSSAKGSSSAGKEAAEVVGELENLIDDQSKNISEDKGSDNEGFETIVDDKGEPSTEL